MNKIQSIHFLRGIACFLVIVDYMFFSTPKFNIGACGVGIFFLVSGFVIPISLKNVTPLQFMIRRSFRLYPVAIISTLLIMFFNKFFFRIWIEYPTVPKLPDTISLQHLILTTTQIWDLCDIPIFRPIFWTLVIEEKFYWIMAFTKHFNKDNSFHKTANFGLLIIMVIFFLCFFMNCYYKSLFLRNIMFISYMYIGVCLYYFYANKIAYQTMIKSIIMFSSLFLIILSFATSGKFMDRDIYMIERVFYFNKYYILTSYGISFIIFYILFDENINNFQCKYKFAINNFIKFISFIATISYPLYVIHSEIWNKIGAPYNYPYMLNNILYFLLCVLFSYFIHNIIEKPFIKIGKSLTTT